MLQLLDIDSESIYNGILQSMEIMTGEPLYPGDERRMFTEAIVQIVVAIANQCNTACNNKMLAYAQGEALDALGDRMSVERIPAKRATATFKFTLTAVQALDVTIPAGTLITTDGDIYFETVEDLTVAAGDSEGTVTGMCTVAGEEGNGYSIGSIAQLVDSVDYVSTASNTTVSDGGEDEEEDDDLRERIRLANSAYSTAGSVKAYEYWAKSADASIIDVVVDSPSACVVNLYILCEGGELPDSDLLDAVEAVCGADDVRPLTDQVSALAPTAVPYDITIHYYTTAEDEEDVVETIEGEGGAIDQYVEWQQGAIGRDINPDKLLALCVAPSYGTGCLKMDITYPAATTVGDHAVAQLGTLTVTHEVISE